MFTNLKTTTMKFSLYTSVTTLFLIIGVNFNGVGQLSNYVNITFEDTVFLDHLQIDTNSVWQIGNPQKNIFNGGFNSQKAIVTDTINSYRINDTSSFIVSALHTSLSNNHTLRFTYKSNTDSINDYLKLEISSDRINWTEITNDLNNFYIIKGDTFITGNIDWAVYEVQFHLWLINNSLLGPPDDTISFRFSFITDSVQTNKDGIMIDDITINLAYGSVEDYDDIQDFSIYPNPFYDNLNIETKNKSVYIEIYDLFGKKLLNKKVESTSVDLSFLNSGVYFLKVHNKTFKIIKF